MENERSYQALSRRRLLRLAGLGLAGTALATACGQPATAPAPTTAPAQPTAAPAKPAATSAAKPGAQPAASPAAKPGAQPAAASPAASRQLSGSLTLLMWNHFVPEFDQWFDAFAQDWGQKNKVNLRVDHIPHLELPARQAAEVAAQAGHDLMHFAGTAGPNLYQKHLENQDELCNRLDKELGGWEESARNLCLVNGHWKAFPDYFIRFPVLYREDLFKQEGFKPPDTWNDLLESGRVLKPKGHPGGIGYVANHVDANASARAILWSFGGKYVDKDGKTVALDSPETREALQFGKTLHDEAMTDEIFAWDDSANNRFLASGRGAWIHNPISAYLSIKKENEELFNKIGIALTPKGPAERKTGASPNTFGIWTFAQNKPAAHAFLSDYADNWLEGMEASSGYDHPMLKGWSKKPMPVLGTSENEKLRILQEFAPYVAFMGYPGPVTPAADEVWQRFLIPQMFGQYIRNGDLEGTVKSTSDAIAQIYQKWQARAPEGVAYA